MSCELHRTQIGAYLDGELPPGQMAHLHAHLQNCPECGAEALTQLQLKNQTRLAGRRYTADAAFKAKLRRQISATTPARQGWSTWMLPAASFAALAVAFVLFLNVQRADVSDSRLSMLTDTHVATLASANHVDVVSTDRHTVKPWFQGRVPFTFDLPELGGTPFTLLGGRVTFLDQVPGAHLIFQVRQHRISVFLFPDKPEVALALPETGVVERKTFRVASWRQGGLRYVALSDVSAQDLESLCKLLRSVR